MRTLGHPAALLVREGSRVAAEAPRALVREGAGARPLREEAPQDTSRPGGVPAFRGWVVADGVPHPEEVGAGLLGTETGPPSPFSAFFYFFDLTFPTCFPRTELWEEGPGKVRTVNPSN